MERATTLLNQSVALASATEGIPRTINLVARAAWIQAAKDKSLKISASHLQSALELVPGVMEIRQNHLTHEPTSFPSA